MQLQNFIFWKYGVPREKVFTLLAPNFDMLLKNIIKNVNPAKKNVPFVSGIFMRLQEKLHVQLPGTNLLSVKHWYS